MAVARYANNTYFNFATDVLTGTKTLNLKNDGNLIGDLWSGTFYLACSALGTSDVKRYELWQGNQQIATSDSGFFSELSVKQFKKGGNCFVRVYGTDGNPVDTAINLEFAENKANKNTSFELKGKKTSVKIDDDVPFLGGSTLNFDLPIDVPVVYSETADSVKIGVNMKLTNNKTKEEQLLDYQKTLERASTALTKQNKDSLLGHIQKSNKTEFFNKCDVTFAAYLEGNIASETLTGYLAILVDLNVFEMEFNTIVVVVPVTVQIGVNFKLEAGAKATYNWGTQTFDGNLMLNPSIKLTAFGGIGIGKLVGIGAYGSAELAVLYNLFGTEQGLRSIDLTGELGLKAYLAIFTYQRAFAHNTWYLYTANKVNTASLLDTGEAWNAGLYDAANYHEADLSYLAAESDWLGDKPRMTLLDAAAKTELTALLTDTYRNAQPVMVSDGAALYAAFARADAESGQRYVALTKYDGTTWSQPVRVDSAAILDSAPNLALGEDGKLYLSYAKTIQTATELLDYAQHQEIVVGTVDSDTLAFTRMNTYSGDGYAHLPELATVNGKTLLAWVDSPVASDDEVLRPASGTIKVAELSGGAWSAASTLTTVDVCVDGLAIGDRCVGYQAEDTLYSVELDGTVTKLADNVTGRVTYGVLPSESQASFLWNGENSLISSTGASAEIPGITREYQVIGNQVYYSAANEDSANLTVIRYSDDAWSLPIQLTQEDRYLENLSVASLNGSDYVLGMRTEVTISEDAVEDQKDLVWSKVQPVSDLRLDDLSFDADGISPGEEVPVTLTVTNAGDHTVTSVDLSLDGADLRTESVSLVPGSSAEIGVTLTCPSEETEYQFSVAEPDQDDYTPEDNSAEINLGLADLAVELTYQQVGESKTLLAVVTNEGIASAGGSVLFYDAEGQVAAESTFDSLAAGETAVAQVEIDDSFAGYDGGDVSAILSTEADELYTYNNEAGVHINAPVRITAIRSAERDGKTVLAEISLEEDVSGIAYCAAYSVQGKLLSIQQAALTADAENELQFTVPEDADTVKLFVIDENHAPLCGCVEQ